MRPSVPPSAIMSSRVEAGTGGITRNVGSLDRGDTGHASVCSGRAPVIPQGQQVGFAASLHVMSQSQRSITVGMIQLDRVTKRFDGKRSVTALDSVSVTIPRGEMISVIGQSGSGKSTLLNLVGGLDRATSGDVRVDGELLESLSDDNLTRVRRDKVGFIFQFFNLLPTLTCLENVGLPLHLRGWPRRKVDERARELLGLSLIHI